jgi:hypothetical protein
MFEGRVLVRRGELMAAGFSRKGLEKLVRAKVLRRVVLPGHVYGKFLAEEVKKLLRDAPPMARRTARRVMKRGKGART